jgi:hypothetical protein
VARWVCPRCDREFGRAHQSHVCVPGCTVEESFAGRPQVYRELYEAIVGYLRTLGPVHADAVKVGVFLKRDRKLAEVRPMARSLSLELVLPRKLDHPRVHRSVDIAAGRTWNTIRLRQLEEVDEELRDWLTEAYDFAGG